MEDDHRLAAWVPARFPVHEISVADIEQAMFVRLDLRIEGFHGARLLHAPTHRKPSGDYHGGGEVGGCRKALVGLVGAHGPWSAGKSLIGWLSGFTSWEG
jgi:hypothetical protein